jgi:hypothetical protein
VLVDDNPSANRCYSLRRPPVVSGEPPYPITATVTDVDGTRRSQALTLRDNTDSNRGDTDLGATPRPPPWPAEAVTSPSLPKPADVRIEIERLVSGKLRVGAHRPGSTRAPYNDGPGPWTTSSSTPTAFTASRRSSSNAGPHPCPHGCQIADNLGKSPFHVSITVRRQGPQHRAEHRRARALDAR